MNKIKIFCDWELDVNLYHEIQMELWVDKIPYGSKRSGEIRIGLFIEPPEIRTLLNVQSQIQAYDYVLTHDQNLLDNFSNCFLYEFGGCWTGDFNLNTKKEFGISTLVGGKKMTIGHVLRTEFYALRDEIRNPIKFWISKNFPPVNPRDSDPVLFSGKSEMFNNQFHVCIENVKRENWFTEKLIDCLYTKTIPIYYGCPNISNWFDIRGFIIVNNAYDLINACNLLNENTYLEKIEHIEKNFELSKQYMNVGNSIGRSIEKNILTRIKF